MICLYQFGTLKEIAQRITDKVFNPEEVFAFQAWLHREEPFLPEEHEVQSSQTEEDWWNNFSAPTHDALSTTPKFIASDTALTMWDRQPVGEAAAREEGARYKVTYFKDAQYVFSHCHHH